jgi:hypothetical protein
MCLNSNLTTVPLYFYIWPCQKIYELSRHWSRENVSRVEIGFKFPPPALK